METYENIKRLREMRGLSQDQLAEMVGYRDRSSIAKVESGRVDLTQSKIAAFAKALGVTPTQLMGIEEEEEEPTEEEDESWKARQDAFDRTEMRVLFDAAKDVPASKIYEVVAMLEKFKEDSR